MDTMSTTDSPVRENYDFDLSSILRELLAHKWLIILITSLGLMVGVFYASRQVPQYQSDVLLQVDTSQSGLGRSGLPTQLSAGMGSSSSNTVATQIALIQSRYVLEPLVESLGLDISASLKHSSLWDRIFNGVRSNRKVDVSIFVMPSSRFYQPYDLLIDKPKHVVLTDKDGNVLLQGEVGKLLVSKSKGISLLIKAIEGPVGTKFVLSKQPSSIVATNLARDIKIEEVGGTRGFSSGTGILNISMAGPDPSKVVKILNSVAQEAKNNNAKQKAEEASQILEFLYKQLPVTKKELERAESALNKYRSRSGKVDVRQQMQYFLTQLGMLDNKINELQISRIDMLQRYTKVHPAFIALETQIKALRQQRKKLEQSLKKLPAADQVAVNLMRDVSVKRNLYLILLNKIQELQVVKAGTVSALRVLTKAEAPNAPLPRKRAVKYLAGLLLGFMFSIMLVLGRKVFVSGVDDPRWSESNFNLPNLAIVPYSKLQTGNKLAGGSANNVMLLAHIGPKCLSIEALRNLRTSLQLSLNTANNNIVSILGISPRVGKSFVSTNLAYLLASSGKKVIVVDCDLRRGTVHKYFNASPNPGLSEVLNEGFELKNAIRSSMHDSLHFLPRGSYPNDPSELLMSAKFKDTLDKLSKEYDVVVVDTAPILLVTDGLIVSGLSGTNYIVFAAGVHQPQEIEMTIRRLSSAGVSLQGSVFNFHKEQKKASYYGGKYYRYSYLEYYDEEAHKE